MASISRRGFLGAAAASAAAFVPGAAGALTEKAPRKWDETVEYLIVGTGFAGLASAIEAHTLGMKNVVVIEKMAFPGGNSVINGGAVAAAGTDMQEKAGIKDSADLLYRDILKAGGGIAHPDLARHIADESVENFYWLRDKIGVKFAAVTYHGGHSVKRSHSNTAHQGSGFIEPMLKVCEKYGIPIRMRTYLEALIEDEKGRVVGAKIREGYVFPKEKSGKVKYVRSKKGVMLACGGFAQNVKMRMSHDPRLTSAFGSTNHPGATGEGIQEAQFLGANTVHMDWIQLGPWTSPDEQGFGLCPLLTEPLVGYGPMVDPKTAKRFVMETGNRKVRADAIVAIGHPVVMYACEKNIMNQAVGKNLSEKMWAELQKSGVVHKFATLKELAAFYNIPYDALQAQNEKFNGYMKAMKDPDFNCKFFKDGVPNTEANGPFYGWRLWPRVHHCMGGLEINNKAQVRDARGNVIPGLYAAGEATGGVHGMVRLGTVAVADCMIFGRTAARTAKAYKPA
ncbi:MAG: flavocytochrome c [Sutterellaceae bacterium]|nr:flavocytochrome c [Sutterellaceae bacterium]